MQHDAPIVGAGAVLEEVQALPGAEHEGGATHRDRERRLGEGGFHVGRHVVRAFDPVDEEWIAVGHETSKESQKIALNVPVCVLLDQERGLRVPAVDGEQARLDLACCDKGPGLVREFD
jgi:hypothetical protein